MTISVEWFDPRPVDEAAIIAAAQRLAVSKPSKLAVALPWPPDLFKDEPEA